MHNKRNRFLTAAAVFALAIAVAAGAQANSSGAPMNAAVEGCTCHGPASSQASVKADGFPSEYTPGTTYNITFQVMGPETLPTPTNQGGFGLYVTAGTLGPRNEGRAVKANGNESSLTHTEDGNNKRSWMVSWAAPNTADAGNVTLYGAGNAVNGDTLKDNFDHWAKSLWVSTPMVVVDNGTGNTTDEPDEGGDGSALGTALVVASLVAAAAWSRRRR